MTTDPGERPRPFITSVRVEGSDGAGPHEWVTLWIRGQNVGTLCVGKGDGLVLQQLLLSGTVQLPSVIDHQPAELTLLESWMDATAGAGHTTLRRRTEAFIDANPESPRAAAERAVLDACAAMQLDEPDEEDEPGAPAMVGEDCYIYTDDQLAIAKAVLALRAVKP